MWKRNNKSIYLVGLI